MAGNERQAALAAASKTRVQNVTTAQTVKSTPALLQSLVISNADAAAQSITITDGATVLQVIWCPSKDVRNIEFFIQTATSLIITPSSANLDCLVLYD